MSARCVLYENIYLWAVLFGSESPVKSKLDDSFFICQLINNYGRFKNGRREINEEINYWA